MLTGSHKTLPAFQKNKAQSEKIVDQFKKKQLGPSVPAPIVAPTSAPVHSETRDEKIKRKKRELESRRMQKDMVIRATPYQARPDGGSIGKAEHLAGLTAEGVAGEMIANLMIFAVELTFNTPFWIQSEQFSQALQQELASLDGNNPVRLTYLPDDEGVYPEIYPIDGQGKVDFTQAPLTNPQEITPFAIRANGYVPVPSMTESLLIVLDKHYERMMGGGVLSPEQKARMGNTIGELNERKQDSKDLASDNASIAAMRALPKPKL